jgi:hypothetical protein
LLQVLRAYDIANWLIFLTTAILDLLGTNSDRLMICHLGAEEPMRKISDSRAL